MALAFPTAETAAMEALHKIRRPAATEEIAESAMARDTARTAPVAEEQTIVTTTV